MCVQQNNFITTRPLKIPKSLPYTPTLDHKRYTNKIEFGSEPSKANLQVNVQVLQTDGSISDQNTPKLDLCMNISHNYVAPIWTTYEIADKIENVNVRAPYNRSEGQKLSLAT